MLSKMKTTQISFAARKLIYSIIVLVVLITSCSEENEVTPASETGLELRTAQPTQGGNWLIRGNVGATKEDIKIMLGDQPATIVHFEPFENVTFKFPEGTDEAILMVNTPERMISFGFQKFYEYYELKTYWVEKEGDYDKLMVGIYQGPGEEPFQSAELTSIHEIVGFAGSTEMGEIYVVTKGENIQTGVMEYTIKAIDILYGYHRVVLKTTKPIEEITVDPIREHIYYLERLPNDNNQYAVKRMTKFGHNKKRLIKYPSTTIEEFEFDVSRSSLFFVANGRDVFTYHVYKNTTTPLYLVNGLQETTGLAVDNTNKIYVASKANWDDETFTIYQGVKNEHSPLKEIISIAKGFPAEMLTNVASMAFDSQNKELYWTTASSNGSGKVYRTAVNNINPYEVNSGVHTGELLTLVEKF